MFLGHIGPNLPIVHLIGTSGGKVLGLLSNLEINYCSFSRVIANFFLGPVVVSESGVNGTNIGARKLIGVGDVPSSLSRNLFLSMLL